MSAEDLFRREALDAQSARWLGAVNIITPVAHRVWAIASAGIASGIIALLVLSHYTRREHVAGALVPLNGLITIVAPAAGVVTSITVKDGDNVSRGNPLLTISNDKKSTSRGDTAADVSRQIMNQQQRLQLDMKDEQELSKQQASVLQQQIEMLSQQLARLDEQLTIEQQQYSSVSELLDKIKPLRSKGYVSSLDVQQQQNQAFDALSQIKQLEREHSQLQQQLYSTHNQLSQLPTATREKENDLQRELDGAEQSLDENEAERSLVLTAPADSVVSSLMIKPGQAASAGEPLLSIISNASVLQAQLLVPSSAIGFVHPGTKVVLHYQAYPYQKFGVRHGSVTTVSRNALTPSEVATLLGGQPSTQPFYLVLVKLQSQAIEAYGLNEPLKPGMLLDADLLLESRSLFEWICEPLYGIQRQYFEQGG